VVGSYVHTDSKKAALVAVEGGDAELARDLAMQVVASSPRYLTPRMRRPTWWPRNVKSPPSR
jgi:elongation factor Ts